MRNNFLKHSLVPPRCDVLSSLLATNSALWFKLKKKQKKLWGQSLLFVICFFHSTFWWSAPLISRRSVFWVKQKSISASQQEPAAATAAASCRAKTRSKRSKPELRSAQSYCESPHQDSNRVRFALKVTLDFWTTCLAPPGDVSLSSRSCDQRRKTSRSAPIDGTSVREEPLHSCISMTRGGRPLPSIPLASPASRGHMGLKHYIKKKNLN